MPPVALARKKALADLALYGKLRPCRAGLCSDLSPHAGPRTPTGAFVIPKPSHTAPQRPLTGGSVITRIWSRVPLFETGIVQVNSAVGTLSSLIWQPSNQSTTTFGALGSITTGDVLRDVTILNTGSGTIYAAAGTTVAGAAPIGIPIAPGGQMTLQGYVQTAGTATFGNIYGICATGGASSTQAGLASVASVV